MHYNYFYGKYSNHGAEPDHIFQHVRLIVDEHAKEWPESSNPSDDTVTRFLQLCGKFGKDAFWIVITDAFFQIVGTCTLGEEDDGIHLYNLLATKDYRNIGFGKKLFNLAQKYAQDKNKKLFGFVKKDDEELKGFYKKLGAVEEEVEDDFTYTKFTFSTTPMLALR